MAARPRTLTAGMSPVVLGGALAWAAGAFVPWVTLAALLCTLLLQVGTNLANDYFDAVNGIDYENRLGPVRVTQAGLIRPERVKHAFFLCFITAAVIGIPLAARGGVPILVIGLLSLLFAYLYTGGPYPLAYAGMGEILAFIFFGLVATAGVYYLNTQTMNASVLVAGSGPGFIAAFLMGVNNLRDIHTDRVAGKRTVPVMLGENAGRWFVMGLLAASVCVPLVHAVLFPAQPWVVLASLGVLPFAFRFRMVLQAPIDVGMNRVLAGAGQYLAFYALLFSLGLLI